MTSRTGCAVTPHLNVNLQKNLTQFLYFPNQQATHYKADVEYVKICCNQLNVLRLLNIFSYYEKQKHYGHNDSNTPKNKKNEKKKKKLNIKLTAKFLMETLETSRLDRAACSFLANLIFVLMSICSIATISSKGEPP